MEKVKTLKSDIREKIITKILNGEFNLDSILTEKQLIEHFNVSKSTIREALLELCHENILVSMPRYGYRIVQLSSKEIRDVMEVRLMLELQGFDKLITHITDNHIKSLKEYNHESDQIRISNDVWTHWNNNVDFHLLLASFANNSWLDHMLRMTMNVLSRAYAHSYLEEWGNVSTSLDISSHKIIAEKLEKGEFESARFYLKEDILSLKI